jgi:hypothetical protein
MDSPWIRTGMPADKILPLIPGDCIAAAAKTLPDAEKDAEEFREAIVEVPGGFRATIRFEHFRFKRGKMTRWFWAPHSAERIE